MSKRAYNFNAGPAALPLSVLQKAQEQLVEYQGIGMSIMEISHRSKEYEALNNETQQLLKDLYQIPDGYNILFLQGGASSQFAMIPMNFLRPGKVGSYVNTGAWAEKALKEAKLFGEVHVAASTEADQFMRMPAQDEIQIHPDAAYVHVTSNETIGGAQFASYPATGDIPLIVDMSSDILSRPVDVSMFGMIYAGAQKNLGPSGVTVVIVREDMLKDLPKSIPTMMRYGIHADNNSLYNTPPVYSVYMMNLVLKWIVEQGGLEAVEKINVEKTNLIYNAIDHSDGFYQGCVNTDSRSRMNITFRLANEDLEKKFIKESEAKGFVGLKGHRSVGGLRASTYNAVPFEACEALATFMEEFRKNNS
ncbi:3-phosphoserine/phosphohydroxythreonine transaminase [Paenibacillus sp. N1-5-1-14]|uniref:3-phosphoserine/phosphohydroxythreonine transaminase n=1 Tax=Paenibacillus radicibacter TaxID=2972488 RepID=UPI0021596866|nr:3-phosphoserine/phosphohydroxythreonine transaminase [Paenibacillus radicibacter]MCR8644824.1 3-phosphoserine/phosphohydroxythreonine transaminase [Paenibacillus radicibacter]